MFRWVRLVCAAVLLVAVTGRADTPQFSNGGFVFTIQYGPGFWGLAKQQLADQTNAQDPGGADIFVADVQNTHTLSLRAAYNILGHASLGAELTATGWNLFDTTRGGAGFAIGSLTWHPLELIFMQKDKRPIPLDVGTFFGAGYGIAGERRGLDGLLFEWGLNVDWYFSRFFALGIFTRGISLNWNTYYIDYNNRSQPGASVNLPKTSGGSFWTFGISLNFRAGD